MARKPPKWLKWIPPKLRKGIEQLVPYVPSHPQPIPPPPYVPPPAGLTITAPVQNATVNDDTPAVTGTTTGTGNVTVAITQAGATVQTLAPVTPSGGTWVATAAHLADGVYTASATQTIGGQDVTVSKTFTVAVVTPPPPPPQVVILVPSTGSTMADNTPTIAGTASGATAVTVLVKRGGTTVQTLSPTPSGGTWTTTAATLADGAYTVEAAQTVSGVTGNATPIVFTVDAVPNPAVTSVAGGGQGSSTTDDTPTIAGTAGVQSGDATTVTVIILQGGSTVRTIPSVAVAQSGFPGAWSTTLASLAAGSYVVRATQGSASGTGTSGDFPFTITVAQPVPTPTITNPTEGQALTSGSLSFSGTGGVAQGDAAGVTVRVYPSGSGTQFAQVSANVVHGGPFDTAWAATPISVPDGSWRARVEQGGTSGLGVSAFRNFTVAVPTSVAIAMPRGPVNGFAQAADFYDSVGVNHHPEYYGNNATNRALAISRIQELGIRHVRCGLWSPATHGDVQNFQEGSQFFMVDMRNANTNRNRSTTQPCFILVGTPPEPKMEAQSGNAVYTMATFLKPLDGPQTLVPAARRGPSPYNSDSLLESAGRYYDVGWEAIAAIQGPNEPDGRGAQPGGLPSWYADDMRLLYRNLRDARNARPNEIIMGGEDYIDSSTGRITAGPAHAPQLPIVGWSCVGNNWASFGDYSGGENDNTYGGITVGSPHIYAGGWEPIWDEYCPIHFSNEDSYNGDLRPVGAPARTIPTWVTEVGNRERPGSTYSGERYVPSEINGEYLIRHLHHNYKFGRRRTYLYKLSDEPGGVFPPWVYGMMDSGFNRRSSFYAIKNLLAVVGWRQGGSIGGGVPSPISVPYTFTAGPPDSTGPINTHGPTADMVHVTILQTTNTEYLVLVTRDKMLWDRDNQTPKVPAARDVTLTLPAGTWATSVCEPAKVSFQGSLNGDTVANPNDGQTYANAGNGQSFAAAGTAGNGFTQAGNTLTLRMAGLTRIVKIIKTG